MLIAGVIDYELNHHLHVPLMRRIQELLEVAQSSIRRIHIHVIRNVIAIIAKRGREEWQEPQTRDPKILQVVQLRHQPLEIPDPIIVGIGERTHVNLVNDRVFVPERISCACNLLHSKGSKLFGCGFSSFCRIPLRVCARIVFPLTC
jgi:hypothetical protein